MENNWFREYTKSVYKAGVLTPNIECEPSCKFGILMIKKDGTKEYRDICTVELTEKEINEIKQEYGKVD